jgi:hypothetical protein
MSRRTRRRRAEARYGPEVGTTYLLHFIDPATGQAARYQHAGHYIGWTQDLPARLQAHASGSGARLVEVITRAGLGFTLARTWPQTTRDREDLLKHIGDARRFCPECGVKPRLPAPANGPARPSAVRRAEAPADVPAYDFADWPDLTLRHTAAEAAELTACLARGREKAYEAATAAGGKTGPGREYLTLFDAAIEVDFVCQKVARETVQFHGREPDEPMDEWIDRIRQEAPRQPQEDDMFRRTVERARQQAEADQREQAEADRLFALADELDKQAGERPDYRREITRERAARIMRQLGEPLPPDIAVTGPDIAGLHPDSDVALRPGTEFRDSAGTMDPDRSAQALGRRREDVQAAVREQADREAQLNGWTRRETARLTAADGAELSGAELNAEVDRLAEMFPDPAPGSTAAAPDYYLSAPGSVEHRTAYREMFAAADGSGFAHPDADLSYEIDNAQELAAERYYEDLAAQHYGETGEVEAEESEPGLDAMRWSPQTGPTESEPPSNECGQAAGDWPDPGCRNDPALAGFSSTRGHGAEAREADAGGKGWNPGRDVPDHLYGSPECAEPGPETAHFGWAAEPQDAGRFPLPRVLDPSQASPVRAPVAATLADGTPHADPLLAERGWQARGGLYVRQPQTQLEAG